MKIFNNCHLEDNSLLRINDLKMYFQMASGFLGWRMAYIKAVDGVSFSLKKGETLGLVGESGCGKTTVGRCVLRLYEPTSGQIVFKNKDITHLPERKIKPLRREMGVIFQDPSGSLDPRQTAGSIVGEPLIAHHITQSKKEYREKLAELFHLVGLDNRLANRVPHEFSGGQKQRIGIARTLACNPSLIVCDEPISALDVSIQAQIINLLKQLQRRLGLTYLFIAHDLSVVRHMSDRIAVMYLGHIIELSNSAELYKNPLHPYTKALLSAIPIPNPLVEEKRNRILLTGEVPSPLNPPTGCCFHPRCREAIPDCTKIVPSLRDVGDSHEIACIRI